MDQVVQFCDFTGAERQTAIEFIRGNGNNLEAAVGAFFDNPDPSRYRTQNSWDEGAFNSDRQGVIFQGPVNQSFTISDSIPPSRPPSRAMNQQMQMPASYGKTTTTEDVWDMSNNKTEYEGEDEAMRQSMEVYQGASTGREIVPDAELANRSRSACEPAFLKPLVNRDFLPVLITVLHSVNKCRNALLSVHHHIDDYGNNPQWWSGESIQTSTITYHAEPPPNRDFSTSPQPASPLEVELQRLMAFLDKSNRSYGSAESLSRAQGVASDIMSSVKTVARFMKAWDDVRPHSPLFNNVVVGLASGGSAERQDVRLFEIHRPSIANGKVISLYEALDNTLWTQEPDGTFDLTHFVESLSPVMAFQIDVHNARSVDVPPELFVDRYMHSHSERLQEINKKNEVHAQNLKHADEILDQLLKVSIPADQRATAPKKPLDALEIFSNSIEYLTARQKEEEAAANADGLAAAVRRLQRAKDQIEARSKELKEQKDKTKTAMTAFSTYMTREEDKPNHRYTLRGVAQSSFRNTTIFSKYPDPESPKQDRWWRMAYDTGASSSTVTKSVVPRSEVYEAAGKGIDKTFLVYVRNDYLDDTPAVPLPASLQSFVDRDDADFQQETHSVSESMEVDKQIGTMEDYPPYQPSMTRRSSGSSTKVHLGDDDMIMSESISRPLASSEDDHTQSQPSQASLTGEMQDKGGSMFLSGHTASSNVNFNRGEVDMVDSSPEPEKLV